MSESKGKGYKFFDQTAEVGLTATGASLGELFTHAAQGLAELLAAWLKELLSWFSAAGPDVKGVARHRYQRIRQK